MVRVEVAELVVEEADEVVEVATLLCLVKP
jgi:hypothetical protein